MVIRIKKVLNERKKGSPVHINHDILSAWDGATDFCILVTNNFEKDLDYVIVWEILVAIKRGNCLLHTCMCIYIQHEKCSLKQIDLEITNGKH